MASCQGIKEPFAGGLNDFEALLDQLKEWHDGRKTGLRITVTATVLPKTIPRNEPAVVDGARTTTNVMLANLPANREALTTAGNHTLSVIERWPCKAELCSCPNKGYTCYIVGREEHKDSHYPVYGEALSAWSKGIAEGTCTAEDPGTAIVARLVELKHKERRNKGPSKGSNDTSESRLLDGSLTVNVHSGAPSYTPNKRRRAHSLPSSSLVRVDISQSVDSAAEVASFFD